METERSLLRATVQQALGGHTRVALIGYPDHWNAGDMAIWVGTLDLLRDLGVKICYACDPWSYDREALARALPEGPILLIGGGNFGDVYADEITLRRKILTDWRDRKIVQLPQSIWFRETSGRREMADLLEAQNDFIMMVRDRDSLAYAERYLPVPTVLCPDMALSLNPNRFRKEAALPDVDFMQLWRVDIEGATPPPFVPDARRLAVDWMAPGALSRPLQWFMRSVRAPRHGEDYTCWRRQLVWCYLPYLWEALAWARVARGCQFLQRGRVVLTNRLHGHLLTRFLGRPQVVCDNEIGKLAAYWNTWPLDDPSIHFAATPEAAREIAQDLLGRIAAR
jgi:exopolysaccharide biosynthesis predicted pyruvyltransferase EpsI